MKWSLIFIGLLALLLGIPLLEGNASPPNALEPSMMGIFVDNILGYWLSTIENLVSYVPLGLY